MSYEPPENDAVDFTLESYDQPANDAVDFSLVEEETTEEPKEPLGPFQLDTEPLNLDLELDLPLRPLNLRSMQTGLGIFIIGMLGILGGASWILKNWIGMAMLGMSVVALLVSGVLGVTLGFFWAMLIATVLVLIVGALWRMMLS